MVRSDLQCSLRVLESADRRVARSLTLALAAFFVFGAYSASAQMLAATGSAADSSSPGAGEARADSLEEVVVTGRKREEKLIQAPLEVSVLTSAALERYSSNDISRIADRMPQVELIRSSSGSGATMVIRGISSTVGDPGLESSVGLDLDGVQVNRGFAAQAASFDLQQVEVLKGPQALYFGKNSPAGIISLKSNGPTDALSGYAKAGYEFNAAERYFEGAIGGPITDTLGARVAVRASDMDGWLKNTAGPSANPNEPSMPLPGATNNRETPAGRSYTGRLTLEYKPVTDFSVILKIFGSDYRDNEISGLQQVVACNGRPHPTSLGIVDVNADCIPDNYRSNGNVPAAVAAAYPFTDDGRLSDINQFATASVAINGKVGAIRLTSNTGYYDLAVSGFGQFDFTTYATFPSYALENIRVYTEELRAASVFAGPINFMLGAFYESNRRRDLLAGRGGFGFPVPFDPNYGGASIVYQPNDITRGDTYSGFGQTTWDIVDNLQLSAGVRYTNEEKSGIFQNVYVNPLIPAAVRALHPVGELIYPTTNENNWSPEATLSWHPTSDQTLYAAYKTGYKSAGFSVSATLTAAANAKSLTFGPETVKGEEIGYKAVLLDHRLTLTSALYDYTFKGLQRSSRVDVSFQVSNAAKAVTRGAEIEADMRVAEGFNIRTSATYNVAKFLAYPGAPCYTGQTLATGCANATQDLSGEPLSLAPKVSLTTGFTYDIPVLSTLGLAFNSDVKYVSGYRTEDDGQPDAFQDGYAKVNAGIRLHDARDRWDMSLIGLNLLNKYAILISSNKPGGAPGDLTGVVERGREVRLEGSYRF
jgi:iron complex outermembrane recepter protein